MKLYHYTSVSSFSKIWQSKALRFSEGKGTNDYFERHKVITADNGKLIYNGEKTTIEVIQHNINVIFEEINKYKQISLCRDYSNGLRGYASPMMWGQYARYKDDNGVWQDGVCIELDEKKLNLATKPLFAKPVLYEDYIQVIKFGGFDFTQVNAIEKFIEKNKDILFFTKHRHWEHENEHRIVSNKLDYLDISVSIKGIYVLGMDSPAMKNVEKITQNPSIINILMSGGTKGRTLSNYNLQQYRDIIRRNEERIRKMKTDK